VNLLNTTLPELADWLAAHGEPRVHAASVFKALYRQRPTDLDSLAATLPAKTAALLLEHAGEHGLPQPVEHTRIDSSDGKTRKFLLGTGGLRTGASTPDSETTARTDDAIETVLMAYKGRHTACVSSQAGCAMGCVFCATGQMGFKRHLEAGEIVAQVVHVVRDLATRGQELRNIVFMGMGEPLHNYDNVMRAIDIITDRNGLATAPRRISVSTVGIPRRIRQLADEARPIHLAVSLHGATEAERQALVPVARKYTLDQVMSACRYYTEQRGRRIFFEWALIANKNDTPEQATALAALVGDMPCTVNLIPLNPTGGFGGEASDPTRIETFRRILHEAGIRSTLRQRRGIDVAAGCGQLANASLN